jgi:purine-binding chemotaxis protein CheW
MTALESASPTHQKVAGKYLTFVLGKESYGIAVLKIREIIRLVETTAVPQMPAYIRGVINLRGKVIPIIDLRVKFGLSQVEETERTCIVVVQIETGANKFALMGLIVDAVEEVVNIPASDIEPTPDFGSALDTAYILGMAKCRGQVKTLLDIDSVITTDAIFDLGQGTESPVSV